MKPDYFPALESINIFNINIVTIPDISRFPRLKSLDIRGCKLLREIQGLPQSIRRVIEIIGILPSRVCGRARSNKLMDPQFTNYFPSKTEGAKSEDGDISMNPQFTEDIQDLSNEFKFYVEENNQFLFSLTQRTLQRHLNKSNPTDQNLVEVSITYELDDTCYSIKRWGVHVECTCPPQESANAPIWYSIKRLGFLFAFDAKLTGMVVVESLRPVSFELEEMKNLSSTQELSLGMLVLR
ncbi:hypothetical protein CFP56_039480 [Quercus suber]|uniref:Uncharacterized protein n=1 Tax=Quercus suber TaxID=58331 RepID=A0AAW0IZE4_QUESU